MRCEPRESWNISWGLGELALTLSVAVPPGRMVPSVPGHRSCTAGVVCQASTSTRIWMVVSGVAALKPPLWNRRERWISGGQCDTSGAISVGFLGKQSQLDFFPAGGQSVAPHLFWWDFGKVGVEVGGVESTKTSESLLGCALPDPNAESCLFPGWQRHWWRKIVLLQVSEQTHDLVIEATY